MTWQWVPMDRGQAEDYLGWRYEAPYDFYNIPTDRAAGVLRDIFEDNGRDYYAAIGEDGRFDGIAEYWFETGFLTVGLGLRPARTGQGLGRSFAESCIDFGRTRYGAGGPIRLTVAVFNERAMHLYRALGFREIGVAAAASFGRPMLYLVMESPMFGAHEAKKSPAL